jgi:hypothetical protein
LETQDAEGKRQRLYSNERIKEFLAKKFGEDWEEREEAQNLIRSYEQDQVINNRLNPHRQVEKLTALGIAHGILKQIQQATNCYTQALLILEEKLPNEKQVIELIRQKLVELKNMGEN